MHISFLSTWRYTHTMAWAVLLSLLIVAIAATIGRATMKLRGALTDDDASLAVMMLLPDEEISDVTMLKAGPDTQEFLAETKNGPAVVRVLRVEGKWTIKDEVITLHENAQ